MTHNQTYTYGTGSAPTTTTSTSTGGASTGAKAGEGLKGIFAKGHGIGETLRGEINGAIDHFSGDTAAQQRDEYVARGGRDEFRTGQFEKKGTLDKAL
ncbi:hypothetical protein AAFC00_000456 [Neodothiora populina]|uniref:Uncharacterized protein n=1 Tax=Neodothiora populina TaxID=2781224 RepID=A0ABR3PE64_9PEZI